MPNAKSKTKSPKKPKKVVPKAKVVKKLPSVLELTKASFKILWQHKKTFAYLILIYALVYLILAQGLSSSGNVSAFKKELSGSSGSRHNSLYTALDVFNYLLGSSSSSTNGTYQIFILIFASLAIIWSLRKAYKNETFRVRDAYYKSMYPLVQYILVLLFILVELIPLAIGLALYAGVVVDGIAITAIEKTIVIVICLGLASATIYLICSSLIALYIVTLPDMTPLKALRSAKKLVKNRRLVVLRKLIFLPFSLIIAWIVLMLPFILIVPVIAAWIFYILSMFALTYVHSYCYSLYRGLINE